MADRILVSTAEMNATIGKYNNAQNTMAQAQQAMSAALENLNGCWKGAAWMAMMAKWVNIKANITKSEMAVNRSILALQNTINTYDTHENENKATATSQDTGTAASIYVD